VRVRPAGRVGVEVQDVASPPAFEGVTVETAEFTVYVKDEGE
jgi:hypothetical protein